MISKSVLFLKKLEALNLIACLIASGTSVSSSPKPALYWMVMTFNPVFKSDGNSHPSANLKKHGSEYKSNSKRDFTSKDVLSSSLVYIIDSILWTGHDGIT